MRTFVLAIAAVGIAAVAACADNPPPQAQSPSNTTTSTSGEVLGPGISGSTEHGLTYGPDGNPYRGNQDPANPASNREPRKDIKDVRSSPNGE